MTESIYTEPCIDRTADMPRRVETQQRLTVAQYEAALDRARSFSRKGRAFHNLGWTESAPPVETLTVQPQTLNLPFLKVRISNPDAYNAQMRVLVGLEHPPVPPS